MISVLVVGQTPPPFHGQAIMTARLLEANFARLRLHHVPMAFSRQAGEIGRFRIGKVVHLLGVILRIIVARVRHSPTILYYPPAGPNRVPMYRDIAILVTTRWLFPRTVFHFHASGLTDLIDRLSPVERLLFRLAYDRPDCAIHLSELTPRDGERLAARSNVVVPYGEEDSFPRFADTPVGHRTVPRILFVGLVCEAKGVKVLVEACHRVKERGIELHLVLMGAVESESFQMELRKLVEAHGLQECVTLLGLRTGDEKWAQFRQADVFCFPSHYSSEGLPVAILEAMQFGLPVVATRWRGIPSLVREAETGFLVPTHDVEALSACLVELLRDPELRKRLGGRGRQVFLEEFEIERFRSRMEAVLEAVARQEASERAPS
jgi:glycosyltransferase involved in cell wall biosynthesis